MQDPIKYESIFEPQKGTQLSQNPIIVIQCYLKKKGISSRQRIGVISTRGHQFPHLSLQQVEGIYLPERRASGHLETEVFAKLKCRLGRADRLVSQLNQNEKLLFQTYLCALIRPRHVVVDEQSLPVGNVNRELILLALSELAQKGPVSFYLIKDTVEENKLTSAA